jgi:NTP pyrophosphatase (non-canonical NTP hydrolase)
MKLDITPANYVSHAMRTEAHWPESKTLAPMLWRLLHAALGITTELAELVTPHVNMHQAIDTSLNRAEEVGDVLWYCAIGYDTLADSETGLCFQDDFDAALCLPVGIRHLPMANVICGDFVDTLKRAIFYGKPIDQKKACAALRGVLTETILYARQMGTDPRQALTANIAKLYARYPHKFDGDLAVHRDLSAEEAALRSGLVTQ